MTLHDAYHCARCISAPIGSAGEMYQVLWREAQRVNSLIVIFRNDAELERLTALLKKTRGTRLAHSPLDDEAKNAEDWACSIVPADSLVHGFTMMPWVANWRLPGAVALPGEKKRKLFDKLQNLRGKRNEVSDQ